MKKITLTTIAGLTLAQVALAGNVWYSSKEYKEEKNDFCAYEISIPQIRKDDGSSLESLSSAWEAHAKSRIAEYKELAAEQTCEDFRTANMVETNFEITTNLDSQLGSVVFTNYNFSGGAHGYAYRNTTNFNTKTGQIYGDLSDFLKEEGLEKLKALVEKKLIENYDIDPGMGWNDIKKSWVSMADIKKINTTTSSSIVIIFDQYEVNAYAAGPQDVELYFYELDEIGLADTEAAKLLTGDIK